MNQYVEIPVWVLAVVIALFIASTVYMVVKYLKNSTLDQLRGDVYQLILRAEHMFTESGKGKQKMEYVVQRARSMLPGWMQVFITEDTLRKTIQMWFDAVKDLLDDGKMNSSSKK